MLPRAPTVRAIRAPQPWFQPLAAARSCAGFISVQLLTEVGTIALPIVVLVALSLAFCDIAPDGTLGFSSASQARCHSHSVAGLSISSAGTALFRTDTGPVLLDLESREELNAMPLPFEYVSSVAQSADGRYLAAGYTDGSIAVCQDRDDPSCVRTIPSHKSRVPSLAFSPDGALLASAGCDGVACVVATDTGAVLHRLRAHAMAVKAVCFAPDQRYLASAGDDGQARIWEVGSGTVVQTCSGHEGAVRTLAFSPDGSELITGGTDGTIRRWNWRSGEEVWRSPDGDAVLELAVAPDGRTIASCGSGYLRLWDVPSGRIRVLEGHTGAVRSVAFLKEGCKLVSASCDGTLRVWDVKTAREVPHQRYRVEPARRARPIHLGEAADTDPLTLGHGDPVGDACEGAEKLESPPDSQHLRP